MEMTYKTFIPNVKYFQQGWDLKAGDVVPLKMKLRYMEKKIVGLLLATAANKARLDSKTQVLMDNYRDLFDVQRLGLRCLLGLKGLLHSYCPALLALGVLVRDCRWNGRRASSSTAALDCITISTVLLMLIIPSDKWLTTKYLRTTILFWSDWHNCALGCVFFEEYGEATPSRLLMRSKEVGIAQPVQQTFDIF